LKELNAYVRIPNQNISYLLPEKSLSTFLDYLFRGRGFNQGREVKRHCPDNSDVRIKASNPSIKKPH
jgi:hypothetical protein